MSIRREILLLLITAAAVPVVVAGLLSYQRASEALSAAVTELHTRSARAEAEHASAYLAAAGAELSGALLYEDPSALGTAEVQEFLRQVFLRRDRISQLALLDREGEVFATEFVDDPEAFARQEPRYGLHDTVSAREALAFQERAGALLRAAPEGHFSLSEPYLAPDRGVPMVVVVASAPAGRELSLAAELNLRELEARLSTGYPDGSLAFFLGADGTVALRPDARLERGSPAFTAPLPAAGEGGIVEFSDQGIAYQAAFSRVPELGWLAVVAKPREAALAPLRALFRSSGVVLLFALAIAFAMARLGSRALARPIAELATGAVEFSRGNFAHRIALPRRDELGDLARTFNEMGQSVEDANRRLLGFNEELRQQVEERTRELTSAQQQLLRSQRLAAVGDLSAGLAHEVNNPLTAIVGNAQLLLMDLEGGERDRQRLTDVLEQALRISDIVKDLQALADSERGNLSPIDVHQVLERAVALRGEELGRAGAAVLRRFHPSEASVLANEPALREVFGQLLSNSLNAVCDRGERSIILATSVIGGQAVMVELTDTGRGIPRENLERIFNPFFTTKQQWSGKGLALSRCHRIIENHGGKISIQSEEDVGTTVTVVLPAAPPRPHLR